MMLASIRYRVCVLIALAAIWAPSSVTHGEQPPAATPAPAEAKTAQAPPAKPQVIYRVPRTPDYAATLHSQAKTQPSPTDSSKPTPRVEQEQAVAEGPPKNVSPPRQQKVKRPKMQSNRPQVRAHKPSKARGPGKSRGKSGKK